jgi:predicted CXXCH cytochrome family protein
MRRALTILFVGFFGLSSAPADETKEGKLAGGGCYACHLESEDPVAVNWKNDVHAKAGIGCETCHGGNPNTDDMDVAKAKETGFKGSPKRVDIPALCGKCHSNAEFMKRYNPLLPVDQLEKYGTSVHGKKIRQGDNRVAQCASCHGAHGIRKVNDPQSPVYASNLPKMCAGCHADEKYMAPYGIPTNQFHDYVESVHGKALLEKGDVRGAPACNDCHGNHGAAPPGVDTIANICGTCHSHNAELFMASPMAKPLSKEPLGECIACHGKHNITHTSDELVGTSDKAVCMKCHKEGEMGGHKGAVFAGFVAESITKYKGETDRVSAIVRDAEEKGMDLTEAADSMQAARQALIQARTELHAFKKEPLEAKFTEGYGHLKKAEGFGRVALKEYVTRRTGLAISTLLLTLVVIALAMKIRSLPPPKP